jgi:hypothetical protein
MIVDDEFLGTKTMAKVDQNGKVIRSFRSKLTKIMIGDLTIWFSFRTPVAIEHPSLYHVDQKYAELVKYSRDPTRHVYTTRYVCDNFWGKHTAFHLNYLDSRNDDSRVSREFIKEKIIELLPKEIEKTIFDFATDEDSTL